jgi:CheY-like chemotaxis protein
MSSISILLIEDDPDDIELMQEALKDNDISFNLQTVSQGDQVLSYLELCKKFPEIIILDLNLPKLHGREVLMRLKESVRFKDIPVVILTTSSSLKEKEFCLNAGARSFISKPSTVEGFNMTIAEIVGIARPVEKE